MASPNHTHTCQDFIYFSQTITNPRHLRVGVDIQTRNRHAQLIAKCPNICPNKTNPHHLIYCLAGCITHGGNGHISTSALKSDVTVVFLDPNSLEDAKISEIVVI